MHAVVSKVATNVFRYRQLLLPLFFVVFGTAANIHQPVQHSLLFTAVSWVVIWILLAFRVGVWSHTSSGRKHVSWIAGACFALAQLGERAACDKEGTWTAKSLVPLLVVLFSGNNLTSHFVTLPTAHTHEEGPRDAHPPGSYKIIWALTISAGAVLVVYSTFTTTALGLSSAIFTAIGLVTLEAAVKGGRPDNKSGNSTLGLVATNGTLSPRDSKSSSAAEEQRLAALRDFGAAFAILCAVSSWCAEPAMHSALSWDPHQKINRGGFEALLPALWVVSTMILSNILLSVTIFQYNATSTSVLVLLSLICAKLYITLSFTGIWFTVTYASSAVLYTTSCISGSDRWTHMRTLRRVTVGVTTLFIALLLYQYVSATYHYRDHTITQPAFSIRPPVSPFQPIPMDISKGHPAAQLINTAEAEFENVLGRQSKSLAEAVREYRRRNGIAPPPSFDKWYEFAVRNNVVMIDEYDTINQMLLPFWGVKPATLRSRITRELGGEDNALIGVTVRNGEIVHIEKGDEWQQEATSGMMAKFVQHLPDMDLGFNIHDEPRVVVPINLLSAITKKAQEEVLPRAAKNTSPRNAFSPRPEEINDGKRFVETYVTGFNRFSHQQTWTHSRLSCPADSQAQIAEDNAPDNLTAFATGPLNYIYDTTAFSDICISPSLSSTFGFFERPNAFSVTHELTPIFSQSKISSFQDILYPSPWYWKGRVGYDESHDTNWENKTNALYWRGSTTGGFSRNGGWRRQHRQHIVQRINAPDKAQILDPNTNTDSDSHSVVDVDRRSLKHLIDVHFSHIGQCDPGDCHAQKEFFHITERADGQDAWYFKHLLDMDGNAFSGRFYSFLKSHSLTYKMAIFREWHAEWLKPWLHYIPLSLRGDEHLDLVKWFSGDTGESKVPDKGGNGASLGERKAREIAERSTEWHDKVLRNVDFEAWSFRLLLEYGRVIDDNREEIGYPGP